MEKILGVSSLALRLTPFTSLTLIYLPPLKIPFFLFLFFFHISLFFGFYSPSSSILYIFSLSFLLFIPIFFSLRCCCCCFCLWFSVLGRSTVSSLVQQLPNSFSKCMSLCRD